jgi:hypothetical protein
MAKSILNAPTSSPKKPPGPSLKVFAGRMARYAALRGSDAQIRHQAPWPLALWQPWLP